MISFDDPVSCWIGFDQREAAAFGVAKHSASRRTNVALPVKGIHQGLLREQGLYTRPQEIRGNQLWDPISEAPMSTEFALTRFLTPILARRQGWALFMDSDVLVRQDLMRLFDLADPSKAVQVVKHDHRPAQATKMDGQAQTAYPRKNWSSVMLFNCAHPANALLTVDLINTVPGRDLHGFCWLADDEIGELPAEWNWLVGHSLPVTEPAIVHFTDGFPLMPGYEHQPYADDWRRELAEWVAR